MGVREAKKLAGTAPHRTTAVWGIAEVRGKMIGHFKAVLKAAGTIPNARDLQLQT
ncbi:UNVERIFIED_CONTAM: hypothetical protein FKN15_032856 [Acipenser sinensis]